MAEMLNFKTEGGIENTSDRFGKMMVEVRKLDLAANLNNRSKPFMLVIVDIFSYLNPQQSLHQLEGEIIF